MFIFVRVDSKISRHYINRHLRNCFIVALFSLHMVRGRPVASQIRQNVVEILAVSGPLYGYKVSKIYNEVFAPVTQRSIYYHLRKGVKTKELSVHKVVEEKGEYSWGSVVEKTYYTLGSDAKIHGSDRVKSFLKR